MFITAGNVIGAGLTGIFWLILAAIQNVNDYGHINYIIAIGSLAASISLLGLNTAVTTLLPKGNLRFGIQANQLILISSTICAIIAAFYSWFLVFFCIWNVILDDDILRATR